MDGLPPGIVRVTGTCKGKIAITPTRTTNENDGLSYPVVYHCETRRFQVLEPSGSASDEKDFADLNLMEAGYYLNEFKRVDRQRYGGYSIYSNDGTLLERIERTDLDPHDILITADSILYLKYTTPVSVPAPGHLCGVFPIEFELVEESRGRSAQAWVWKSAGKFDTAWNTDADARDRLVPRKGWNGIVDVLRTCYTSLAMRVLPLDIPSGFLVAGGYPLLQVEMLDHIHANSIARTGRAGDILVSARQLDTIFIIDKKTGIVKWALGGPMSKMTTARPLGDPRGGFSHQHSASISAGSLYIFDNANNSPGLPSRAVVYSVDESIPGLATYKYEFAEPNGLRRENAGSIQPVENGRILIGWGGVPAKNEKETTRAVSVFDPSSGREEFAIDFAPGWESYRARGSAR